MNLNVSSTDSTDENLVSNERNSGSSSASISISFSDDGNEKPSQALLTKIKKIKSLLKASSTMIPPNQDQSNEDDIASLPAKGDDSGEENKIENPVLKKSKVSKFFFKKCSYF